MTGFRLRVVAVALATLAPIAALAVSARAAVSPSSVTVGVRNAAPASVKFHGGPITGTADGSGQVAPVSCSPPSCEQLPIKLEAPSSLPAKRISMAVTVTFTAPAGNPSGLTGLDLWLLDSTGNVMSQATLGSSPASVAGTGLNPGTYTLQISGEAGANNETYAGDVTASLPTPTPPAAVGHEFTTGILPPAPDSGLTGRNEDAEPGIGVDGNGTFWVASDIEPYAAADKRALEALSGTDVWKSTDGGKHWKWVAAPFNDASTSQPGLGGEDTDIAVASQKNSNGFYNLYVASLWVGSTNIAVSQDGGKTWNVTQVNGEPVQDRPWLAADGPCVFYLSYHAIVPYDTVVDKYDACNPAGQAIGSAVDPTNTTLFAGNILPNGSNRFGKQVVDNSAHSPYRHRIYVPMEGCSAPSVAGVPEIGAACADKAHVFVGYSDDGTSYKDVQVAAVPTDKLFIWPDTVATDSAGNVYLAWFDGQTSYLSVSRNGGKTWAAPVRINQPPARSTAYPTVTATSTGHVEVAFYGSTRAGDADTAKVMGAPNTYAAAHWQLYDTRSTNFGRTWHQTVVTPTIHTGALCYNGSGCGQAPGDRNLLDDFGIMTSPTTGNTVITFDNDQPDGVNGKTHTDFAMRPGAHAGRGGSASAVGATGNGRSGGLAATGLASWIAPLGLAAVVLALLLRLSSRRRRVAPLPARPAPGPRRTPLLP